MKEEIRRQLIEDSYKKGSVDLTSVFVYHINGMRMYFVAYANEVTNEINNLSTTTKTMAEYRILYTFLQDKRTMAEKMIAFYTEAQKAVADALSLTPEQIAQSFDALKEI